MNVQEHGFRCILQDARLMSQFANVGSRPEVVLDVGPSEGTVRSGFGA